MKSFPLHLRHQRCRWQRRTSYRENLAPGEEEDKLTRLSIDNAKSDGSDDLLVLEQFLVSGVEM